MTRIISTVVTRPISSREATGFPSWFAGPGRSNPARARINWWDSWLGKLEPTQKGRYDIRGYLNREGVDEEEYAKLRATGMGHHQIMKTLSEGKKEDGNG